MNPSSVAVPPSVVISRKISGSGMVSINIDTMDSNVSPKDHFFEKYRPISDSFSSTMNTESKVSKLSKNDRLTVSWHDLTYTVPKSNSSGVIPCLKMRGQSEGMEKRNIILKSLSGQLKSGELTAIMGPSGCGKTTLLECISGKRQSGVTGSISFSGSKDVNLSFISQNDQLLAHLSVRESLLFASRLKNHKTTNGASGKNGCIKRESITESPVFSLDVVPNDVNGTITCIKQSSSGLKACFKSCCIKNGHHHSSNCSKVKKQSDHDIIVSKLLEQFGLTNCAEVKVSNCSGGQLKRLSIAQELVSKPNLLILDEPTSGLDSASCFQCIELLQQLTSHNNDSPLAVVATIHQPSARVFNMFSKVIFLSTTGRCIFQGSPSDLVIHLSSVGLQCPPFNNPADYMSEVASGEYGLENIHKLADVTSATCREIVPSNVLERSDSTDVSEIDKRLNNRKHLPFFEHIRLLFKRTVLSIIRDPMLTTIRFFSHIIVAIFIGLLYGSKIGSASGCPPVYTEDNLGSVQKHLYDDIIASGENVANLFFATMFVMYGAMLPTVLTFPLELNVFLKERRNGWYNSRTYYLAKTLADVPMQIVFPVIYGVIIFTMNGQVFSTWRLSMFLIVLILTGLVAQSQGLIVSALFMHDPNGAVFVGPMTSIPFLLFAGFFVRVKTMPSYLVCVSYFSYLRYALEALISLIYGFNRCLETPLEIPKDSVGAQGTNLFKFLTVFLSPDYDYANEDSSINGTEAINGTDMAPPMSSASTGLIESIVKDFQKSNPFMSDMLSGDGNKNATQSYVMKQFDLDDNSLYINIGRLIICFLVFRIAAYLILLWKTDRKK